MTVENNEYRYSNPHIQHQTENILYYIDQDKDQLKFFILYSLHLIIQTKSNK